MVTLSNMKKILQLRKLQRKLNFGHTGIEDVLDEIAREATTEEVRDAASYEEAKIFYQI